MEKASTMGRPDDLDIVVLPTSSRVTDPEGCKQVRRRVGGLTIPAFGEAPLDLYADQAVVPEHGLFLDWVTYDRWLTNLTCAESRR